MSNIIVKYSTSARATGGRDGQAATLDGSLDLKLTTPKELGGPGGEGANPEQLFAMGYAACFLNAVKFIGLGEKLHISPESTVTATVGIGTNGQGGYGLDVALAVSLPGLDHAKAQELVEKAHRVCPYSNAVRGNIDVRLSVE